MTTATIRLAREELELFSAASHDRNPLHLSESYARKTPFGRPVAFGMLGLLACVGRSAPRAEHALERIKVDFPNPLFPGTDYRLELREEEGRVRYHLRDGRRSVLTATAEYRSAEPGTMAGRAGKAAITEAVARDRSEFARGTSFEGRWSPRAPAFEELLERLDVASGRGDPQQHAALTFCSFLVGMVVPGRQALFSQLSLEFEPGPFPPCDEFGYGVVVKTFQPLFNLLVLTFELTLGGRRFATGEIRAFVRETIGRDHSRSGAAPQPGGQLDGKVGLVIGGSRGLGASIVQALVDQGATVYVNFERSIEEAAQLRRDLESSPGEVVLAQGDASDMGSCGRIRERIVSEHGRLDLLVCNACPTLLPLWVEPESVPRIREHIASSVDLVLSPLSECVDLLAASSGMCILVSSIALSQPVAEWPHYVAAKGALEALLAVTAAEYPDVRCLVVRPSRLLTDLTNTPLGKKGAVSPEVVAAAIVRRIGEDAGERVEYLEEF